MGIEFGIASIEFSDGTIIEPPRQGVTVIVGPNNTGKTASLQEIVGASRRTHFAAQAKVIRAVAVAGFGTSSEFEEWIAENTYNVPNTTYRQVRRFGSAAMAEILRSRWEEIVGGAQEANELIDFFVLSADVDSRAQIVGMGAPDDLYGGTPGNPVHLLYLNGELEQRLSDICERNFGVSITLQRLGPGLRLRVGKVDMEPPPINRPSMEYAQAEAALPPLVEQGHGMRSFIGLVLILMTQAYPVIFVDEPEAFLHPPQRRALGRLITEFATAGNSQVFVATHDTEMLWGLLDGGSDVTVVRLTRRGDINPASQISAGDVKRLWTDSLLRYSRVFDGLFYSRVVICESDSDCRFYSAVSDHLASEGLIPQPDCLFVPAGSKDRIHVALNALRSVGVDAVAAVDFDALREEQTLEKLVKAAGGDWALLKTTWERCSKPISEKRMSKPISAIRVALDELLQDETTNLDRDTSKKAIQLLAFRDGWEEAKKAGTNAVPNGDATVNCSSLIESLAGLGIFVLPDGELESLVREVAGHGPKWVAEVLSRGLHRSAAAAQDFVRRLLHTPEDVS